MAEQDAIDGFELRLWPRMAVLQMAPSAAGVMGLRVEEVTRDPSALFRAFDERDHQALERALQRAATATTTVRLRRRDSIERILVHLAPGPTDPDGAILVRGSVDAISIMDRPSRSIPVGREVEPTDGVRDDVELVILSDLPDVEPTPEPGVVQLDAPAPAADPGPRVQDVAHVVAGVIADADLGNRVVHLEAERCPMLVHAETIEHAVTATLDNVRQHTPDDACVIVTVARTISGVLVSVRDEGPGMAATAGDRWPAGADRTAILDVAHLDRAGAGVTSLLDAADRHAGRATIQSSSAGTTVRLLLHPTSPLVDPDANDERPDLTARALEGSC